MVQKNLYDPEDLEKKEKLYHHVFQVEYLIVNESPISFVLI